MYSTYFYLICLVTKERPFESYRYQATKLYDGQLMDRSPGHALLVTVATSDTIPGTVSLKAMASTGIRAIAVSGSEDFWSNASAISSRSRQKGLQNAVEGYIQNIKISNEGETTKIEAKAYRSQVALLSGQAL